MLLFRMVLGNSFSHPCMEKIIGNKCVFHIKLKIDRTLKKYKSWVVAKGFQQIQRIYYTGKFSLEVKPTIIIIVLTLALKQNWYVHQLDVNASFLNGDIMEDVYITKPKAFICA